MGLLDKLFGKTGNTTLLGLDLGKIDDLVKMLGDSKSNVDLSTGSLKGYQDIISKYLSSKSANNEIVEQLKDGFMSRFLGNKTSTKGLGADQQNIINNIMNELNNWLSKN